PPARRRVAARAEDAPVVGVLDDPAVRVDAQRRERAVDARRRLADRAVEQRRLGEVAAAAGGAGVAEIALAFEVEVHDAVGEAHPALLGRRGVTLLEPREATLLSAHLARAVRAAPLTSRHSAAPRLQLGLRIIP